MDKKYISYSINNEDYIFTFNISTIHKEMDMDIRLELWDVVGNAKRKGAGFVTKNGICYGTSESMGLDSRMMDDTRLINTRYHSDITKNFETIEFPIALNEYILYRKEHNNG